MTILFRGITLFTVVFTTLLLGTDSTFAQKSFDKNDGEILDTVIFKEQEIVIYEDNTWKFLAELEALQIDQAMADTMSLFAEWWSNDATFPYTYPEKIDLPDTVQLVLTDEHRNFVLPYYSQINSGFGWRGRRPHKGLDIELNRGDEVVAAFDGKVRYAKYNSGGYGKLVIIRHFNGLETYYAHLHDINVEPEQVVKAGQVIGTGGNTGASWSGPHLHFEMRYLDQPFDPLLVIDYDSLSLKSDTLLLTSESFKIKTNSRGVPLNSSTRNIANTPSGNAKYYTVRPNDTLGHIAVRHGTSIDKLCRYNNLRRTSVLQIGQKIRVQ